MSTNIFGYGIGFERQGTFSVANGFGKNVIIFEVDMSSSVRVDSKKKDFNSWRMPYKRIRWYNTNYRKNYSTNLFFLKQ